MQDHQGKHPSHSGSRSNGKAWPVPRLWSLQEGMGEAGLVRLSGFRIGQGRAMRMLFNCPFPGPRVIQGRENIGLLCERLIKEVVGDVHFGYTNQPI